MKESKGKGLFSPGRIDEILCHSPSNFSKYEFSII
jgi:hypothetical protein